MPRGRAWKDHEKRTAAILNGTRTSQPYANLPDVTGEWVVAECKEREQLPQWLEDALLQAEGHARDGQLPIVVLHQKRRHQKNDVVLLRMSYFEEWFGEVREVRGSNGGSENSHRQEQEGD